MRGEKQERAVGDRVVVSWHRREHAATITMVGRVGYIVETDEPFDGEHTSMMKYPWEVFDIYNDETVPGPAPR